MAIVNLQAYKVDKIEFANALENGTKISLGNKYSYQVQYAVGRVIVVGIFAYNPDEKKEIIHTETFKSLFPYAKALITTVTANCGIQPVIIPNIDIDNQEIYRIDGNKE